MCSPCASKSRSSCSGQRTGTVATQILLQTAMSFLPSSRKGEGEAATMHGDRALTVKATKSLTLLKEPCLPAISGGITGKAVALIQQGYCGPTANRWMDTVKLAAAGASTPPGERGPAASHG